MANSGTSAETFAQSKTIECALSPTRPGPRSGLTRAMVSDATCTSSGSTPAARPSQV